LDRDIFSRIEQLSFEFSPAAADSFRTVVKKNAMIIF
jgi:hypothetical protein